MVDIISANELAVLLSKDPSPAFTLIAQKTNALVTEHWQNPPAPPATAPARVWALTMRIAARAAANPKGLTSWTKSWDDITLTERNEGRDAGGFGIYITDDEIAELNGTSEPAAKTIQTLPRNLGARSIRCR